MSQIILPRRAFLVGLAATLATPALVRSGGGLMRCAPTERWKAVFDPLDAAEKYNGYGYSTLQIATLNGFVKVGDTITFGGGWTAKVTRILGGSLSMDIGKPYNFSTTCLIE